ncbi:MAG: hypothetical protein HY587_04595 [Candidatus Omnitrophica bacterium]|nr:hypothetical protein [Candidatus Omnitrophota bacterium]
MTHDEIRTKLREQARTIRVITKPEDRAWLAFGKVNYWIQQIESKRDMLRVLNVKVPIDMGKIMRTREDLYRKSIGLFSRFDESLEFNSDADVDRILNKMASFTNHCNRVQAKVAELAHPFERQLEEMAKLLENLVAEHLRPRKQFTEDGKVEARKKFHAVKTYPMNGEGKTMRKYMMGVGWLDVPVEGEELAERIKKYMKENLGVSYEEAAITCEKEMLAEGKETGETHFTEQGAQVIAEENVPPEVVEKLRDAKRGTIARLPDGTGWMKVYEFGRGEVIVPVSFEGEEDILAFQDERNFRGGRFIKPQQGKPRGFSKDGTTFTDMHGTSIPVENDAEEAALVETIGFIQNYPLAFAQVIGEKESVSRRAVLLLKSCGLEPMKATNSEAEYAVRAGASDEEKYDRASRYVATAVFGTFEKAIVAALA